MKLVRRRWANSSFAYSTNPKMVWIQNVLIKSQLNEEVYGLKKQVSDDYNKLMSPFFPNEIFLYFYYAHKDVKRSEFHIINIQQVKKKYSRHYFYRLMLQRKMVLWSSLCYWANKNCLFFNFNPSVRSKECNYPSFYLNCAWYNYFVEYTRLSTSFFWIKTSTFYNFLIFCLNKTNSSYGTTHFRHVIITQLLMLLLFVNSFIFFFLIWYITRWLLYHIHLNDKLKFGCDVLNNSERNYDLFADGIAYFVISKY